MHKLSIDYLGPIKHCEIEIENFSVFTGAQASGKSTIAKTVFYFRTIKNDFYEVLIRRMYHPEFNDDNTTSESIYNSIYKRLRSKFLQLFGTSKAMSELMQLKYLFNDDTYIKISLNNDYNNYNFIRFEFSDNILSFLKQINHKEDVDLLKENLNELFCDEFETIFIPSGRSMITILTTQLNYLFALMDTEQKSNLDYCTQKYIELIFKVRPLLSEGIEGYLRKKQYTSSDLKNLSFINKFVEFGNTILKGKYVYSDNEERILIGGEKYVKINFISSGQQEYVWILNILAYQMINGTKTFLVLEEPEAHLYPDAQKGIAELLSMFFNSGNNVMITTHSPYILGSFNNMLFANLILEKRYNEQEKVFKIIDKDKILNHCKAYHVRNSSVSMCLADDKLIANEVIDGASSEINKEYDDLFSIYESMEDELL